MHMTSNIPRSFPSLLHSALLSPGKSHQLIPSNCPHSSHESTIHHPFRFIAIEKHQYPRRIHDLANTSSLIHTFIFSFLLGSLLLFWPSPYTLAKYSPMNVELPMQRLQRIRFVIQHISRIAPSIKENIPRRTFFLPGQFPSPSQGILSPH